MSVARSANAYLDQKSPWSLMRTDKAAAGTALWTCLSVIDCLKTALCPFLPFTSNRLHAMLGFDGDAEQLDWSWSPETLPVGQALGKPEPLFAKLDEAISERESERIGA